MDSLAKDSGDNMVHTRIADFNDINKISSVLAASWKSAYRGIVNEAYLDSLENEHWIDFLTLGLSSNNIFTMIMENDLEIIGAAILSQTEKDKEACLISFYLLPEKIGQGFGHNFYNDIETELKSRACSKCVLDVLSNNKRAIRFYQAHGFIETGNEIVSSLGEQSYICKVFEKHLFL